MEMSSSFSPINPFLIPRSGFNLPTNNNLAQKKTHEAALETFNASEKFPASAAEISFSAPESQTPVEVYKTLLKSVFSNLVFQYKGKNELQQVEILASLEESLNKIRPLIVDSPNKDFFEAIFSTANDFARTSSSLPSVFLIAVERAWRKIHSYNPKTIIASPLAPLTFQPTQASVAKTAHSVPIGFSIPFRTVENPIWAAFIEVKDTLKRKREAEKTEVLKAPRIENQPTEADTPEIFFLKAQLCLAVKSLNFSYYLNSLSTFPDNMTVSVLNEKRKEYGESNFSAIQYLMSLPIGKDPEKIILDMAKRGVDLSNLPNIHKPTYWKHGAFRQAMIDQGLGYLEPKQRLEIEGACFYLKRLLT